jgi:ectoine hydroxylase
MKPNDVMQHPLNVLSDAERKSFFSDGFLVLPDYVPEAWLSRLREATRELLERSRSVTSPGASCRPATVS